MKKVTTKEMKNISTKKNINESEMQKTIAGRSFWGWDWYRDPEGHGSCSEYYCVMWICGYSWRGKCR